MMRPMVIGPDEEDKIRELIRKAAANVVPFEAVALRASKRRPTQKANLNLDFTIDLPFGYRATFTHEEQRPGVRCRHLSVSVDTPNKGPSIPAMGMIMEAFGFKNRIPNLPMFLETPEEGDRKDCVCVNVVEPLDGDLEKLKARR